MANKKYLTAEKKNQGKKMFLSGASVPKVANFFFRSIPTTKIILRGLGVAVDSCKRKP